MGTSAPATSTGCFSGGSPPHAWGHLQKCADKQPSKRFTPTRVGTSLRDRPNQRLLPWFTPTRVGTSLHRALTLCCYGGSPPHAWGHLKHDNRRHRHYRFTPTRVGTSRGTLKEALRFAVHPHTRGDISSRIPVSVRYSGSPPHAWGHPEQEVNKVVEQRFTPTRVGTSVIHLAMLIIGAVHPHTRGDIVR